MNNNVNIYVYDIVASDFDISKLDLLESSRIENILTGTNYLYRLRSLYAGLLLRYALSKEGYELSGPLDVKYNEFGKPYVDGAKNFSITHSGNVVMIAVSESEVGLDTEIIQNKVYSQVAPKVLSADELAEYNALTGKDKSLYFIEKWVIKESYLKFKGTGLDGYPSDVVSSGGLVCGMPYTFGRFYYKNFSYCYALTVPEPAEVNLIYVKKL